jgi:hypothetical protein
MTTYDDVDDFRAFKAPNEIIDYIIDYQNELALSDPVDQVASSAWAMDDSSPEDLTIVQDSVLEGAFTIVRVSGGGRMGVIHRLTNLATTVSGQIHQRTIKVTMLAK